MASGETIEFGLDMFGDITRAADGTRLSDAQTLRHVVDEAALADRVGVDAFGVGEHHRPDFSISAPEVVLAAIASRTTRIRLGSAVTGPLPTREQFDREAGPAGSLYVGSANTVATKIAQTVSALGLSGSRSSTAPAHWDTTR